MGALQNFMRQQVQPKMKAAMWVDDVVSEVLHG